jgi:trans-AT polyketide synthase/acyltransferase/oxidoreductase domain-containing protein
MNIELTPVGHWRPGTQTPVFDASELSTLMTCIREPVHVVRDLARARIGLWLAGLW